MQPQFILLNVHTRISLDNILEVWWEIPTECQWRHGIGYLRNTKLCHGGQRHLHLWNHGIRQTRWSTILWLHRGYWRYFYLKYFTISKNYNNPNKNVSIYFSAEYPHKFTSKLKGQNVVEHDQCEFEIDVEASDAEVTWCLNGKPIQADDSR